MEHKEDKTYKYNPKPEFEQRMNQVLELSGSSSDDKKAFWQIAHTRPQNSIRCNTIKIQPTELKKRLEKEHNWKISQPFKSNPEIMIIENQLGPGEIGRAIEHILGYYYVQEISSMLPLLALAPTEKDSFLDICASPGSKTTQAAAMMNNKGILFANDSSLGRMMVLAANLERCGVSDAIITCKDGVLFCKKIIEQDLSFDKILVDTTCSGEGTLRSTPETFIMWNEKMIRKFSSQQKLLASHAIKILKEGGELVYSTCTHAPEENEEVIQHLINNFDIKVEPINFPKELRTRPGLESWQDKKFDKQIKNCVRIYPQDNNTEGFFIAKIKKLSDKIKEDEK